MATMCDGSTRFIKDTINNGVISGYDVVITPGVFQAISTRSMGEVISGDAF
jgi:hypothetical protein